MYQTAKRIISLVFLLAIAITPFLARAADGETHAAAPQSAAAPGVAIFAAGCFWCVESDFDKVPGVLDTTSGYTGSNYANPTYEAVSTGKTGLVEAVRVTFDPTKVSYKQLLDYYWHHVDLTDDRGQFCDRGPTYRPFIFVSDDEQRTLAEASKKELEASKRFPRIAVDIKPALRFWPAEAEHQNFYKNNPYRYRFYRTGCGRDARMEQLWGSDYTH